MSKSIVDLSNKKFGKLTPVSFRRAKYPSGQGFTVWLCKCDCGETCEVRGNDLVRGKTTSCGCHRKSLMTTHGLYSLDQAAFDIYRKAKSRCENDVDKDYVNYGARGIEFRFTAESFRAWLVSNPRSSLDYQLDRINNDGHYEPGNVRWATKLQQQSNKRTNRRLIAWGITKTLSQWSRSVGISVDVLWRRLQAGWPVEEAIATPVSSRTRVSCRPNKVCASV